MKLTYTESTITEYNDIVFDLARDLADRVAPDEDAISHEPYIELAIEQLIEEGHTTASKRRVAARAFKLWDNETIREEDR